MDTGGTERGGYPVAGDGVGEAEAEHGLPLADLERALEGGKAVIGHLLTRGEWVVLSQWTELPTQARALYARLFARKDRLVALDSLVDSYAEVPDVGCAVAALAERGFAWTTSELLPVAWHFTLYDRAGLSEICRSIGLRRSGARATLKARILGEEAAARTFLSKEGVRLRHRGLLRRLCRVYLGRSDGDLRALVLHRMGVARFAEYTPSTGAGPYPDRRTLVRHESARRWVRAVERQGEIGQDVLARAISMVTDGPPSPPALRRFRARRYGVRVVCLAAEALEKRRQPVDAAVLWRTLHSAGVPEVARRLALCLERAGASAEGVKVCAEALVHADEAHALALARTGRRLARKARVGWRPSPPLRQPDRRRLKLPATGVVQGRPTWAGHAVEEAVASLLESAGRVVIRSENLLWTTLFGMLLRDVVFAPVPGMLPGALQAGPLDLGRPGFASRRDRWLTPALAEIHLDAGRERLQRAFNDHFGEAIWGVAWSHWSLEELEEVCAGLGGPLLVCLLRALAEGAARKGLPDLLVLPGARVRLDDLFPGRLPADVILIEVKSPNDQLRDDQMVWLDRLLRGGAKAEVWDVESKLGTGALTPVG